MGSLFGAFLLLFHDSKIKLLSFTDKCFCYSLESRLKFFEFAFEVHLPYMVHNCKTYGNRFCFLCDHNNFYKKSSSRLFN